MQDYRKLKVWQQSHELVLEVYNCAKNFPAEEKYNITSQVKRAVVSIPTNISEGTGKFTNADTANFFQIGLGSTHEVEYLLFLCTELKFITEDIYNDLKVKVGEVKAMLISLIKRLRNND